MEAHVLYRKAHEDNTTQDDPVFVAYKALKDQVDKDEQQRLSNIRMICSKTGSSKAAQKELSKNGLTPPLALTLERLRGGSF